MIEHKEKVVEMLKSYPGKKRQIEQLKFELGHPAVISGNDLIAGLALGSMAHENSGLKSGHISDRTMALALRYPDIAREMNNETIVQITRELRILEGEVERLEHYLSLLATKQAEVIQRFYFDGLTWGEMEKEMHMSKGSLQIYRNEGLDELARMYMFISGFRDGKLDP